MVWPVKGGSCSQAGAILKVVAGYVYELEGGMEEWRNGGVA